MTRTRAITATWSTIAAIPFAALLCAAPAAADQTDDAFVAALHKARDRLFERQRRGRGGPQRVRGPRQRPDARGPDVVPREDDGAVGA